MLPLQHFSPNSWSLVEHSASPEISGLLKFMDLYKKTRESCLVVHNNNADKQTITSNHIAHPVSAHCVYYPLLH